MKKDINFYVKSLPQRLTVKVEKDENGLWASIGEVPFCYTQATNATDLTEMINDAVFTHFEIPKNFRNKVGYYAPISKGHQRIEEMFRKLVAVEQKISSGKSAKETFNLTQNCVCA
ncbi:MAG: hypothetical protein WCV55_01900 [Candidatus Paceibacterota bacterium]